MKNVFKKGLKCKYIAVNGGFISKQKVAERRFYVYMDDEFFVLKVNEKCQQSYNRLMIHFLVFGN